MGFMCPQGGDEFRWEGGVLVRRLLSVRLTEASPVSQPGYIETDTAVRHLAAQVGEDPDEMLAIAAAGELRSVFTRTDLAAVAPPAVPPGVEHRSDDAGQRELELRRRLNDERGKRLERDKSDDPGLRLLEWYRRKNRAFAPVTESRSQWFPVVS